MGQVEALTVENRSAASRGSQDSTSLSDSVSVSLPVSVPEEFWRFRAWLNFAIVAALV